jgi:transcriptional regulator with XRE-family HTH domain
MPDTRSSNPHPPGIGEKLRTFRKERQLSIRALAGRSGLSPNTISLIENNSASPTVTTLYTLANVLDIPLSAFFIEEENGDDVRLVRAQDRERNIISGIRVSVLPGDILDSRVHILHFIAEPGKGSGDQQMVHPGDELVICLQGELEYRVKDTVYQLQEQDSLAFNAGFPHSFSNPGQSDAHFLVMITSESGQAFRYHVSQTSESS